ncbi:CPBP family intramembrane glutamic endopeptidase [Amaricoccus sp.]|uniref:CPBP family intramembrane glutamic endopeptidase n=1 Tax=Amaricoccus sp. TaxID=1872485 RepID=UPI001B4325E7|nr:CPBP family intramembrane glutamic endopeptidase [Amaricoccus sp.]MBP7242376.1 CPBP family intramembrane metalloprotease [Amaricoccus sp.]
MTPAERRFEAWVAPARARAELWRTAAGFALAFAVWLATALALALLLDPAGPKAAALLYLLSFAGMVGGLALALRLLHRRPLASLVAPQGLAMRRLATGVAVAGGVGLATSIPVALAAGAQVRGGLLVWIGGAAAVLPAVALQAGAEELLFRGYLQQQLAARFRSRLVWMLAPAVGFGALHFDPSLGANAGLLVAAAALIGLAYGDVTAREGDLSPAIGLHIANNAVAILFAPPAGPLDAFGLWAPAPPGGPGEVTVGILGSMAVTLVVWGAYCALRRG